MIEIELIKTFPHFILATDEVGRGPLSGPVVVGAIALEVKSKEELQLITSELKERGVNDSKKLSAPKREKILSDLQINLEDFKNEKKIKFLDKKISYVTWEISPEEIDQENILAASLRGMKEACEHLAVKKQMPMTVLIDGHQKLRGDKKFDWTEIPIIKGDLKSALIGLASIVAKEKRDRYMRELHEKYPEYGFASHFGYPTKKHREAIEAFGPSPVHRKTFKGVKEFIGAIQGN